MTDLPLRRALAADLVAARKAGATDAARAIRALMTALDNAEAVDAAGEGRSEVPRKTLTPADVLRVVRKEVDEIRQAIGEYRKLDRQDRVEELGRGLAVMERYLDRAIKEGETT